MFNCKLFLEVWTFQMAKKLSETDNAIEIFAYVVEDYCTNRLV